MRADPKKIEAVLASLRPNFGERLNITQSVREAHGRGEGMHDLLAPDAVVYVNSTADVERVVAACRDHCVPIIPYGVGTSLEGQVQAPHGGVSLDLSNMDAIINVSGDDLDCRVEAGVTRERLNAHIRDQGLFFPLDPGANATLGGMAATRASGTNAVRYGTMRDVTLGLTVVTPQGNVIRTGSRALKSSAGYDLTRLYVGSEGTLGIITELQLRLFGVPEVIAAAMCQFGDVASAVQAVTSILQHGVQMARIEFLDRLQMGASIRHSKLEGLEERETLFLEFHGSPRAVDEQIALVREICASFGGDELKWAFEQEARTKLWTARHNAYWAARSLRPGCESFATDACVPISSLPTCILEAQRAADAAGLTAPIVGHVGDGNFHMLVLYEPSDPAQRARAEALTDQIARIALAHGGTATGEHGVGLHKRNLMREEHGAAIEVMAALKAALDPSNIMNPGKILPYETPSANARGSASCRET